MDDPEQLDKPRVYEALGQLLEDFRDGVADMKAGRVTADGSEDVWPDRAAADQAVWDRSAWQTMHKADADILRIAVDALRRVAYNLGGMGPYADLAREAVELETKLKGFLEKTGVTDS